MFSIAVKELRSIFLFPLAWTILGVVQMVIAFVFASTVEEFLQLNLQISLTNFVFVSVFMIVAFILLFVVPLITMRLFSEERRNKTLPLLLSSPVSLTSIVLGKYLGSLSFFVILIALLMLMPLSLMFGAILDFGQIATGLLGILLLIGAFTAIGLYVSALTAHPTVAAIGSYGILLLLLIIHWVGGVEEQNTLFNYLSMIRHYYALLRGLFDTEHVVYYLLIIVTFLTLTIRHLDNERI